MGGQQYRGILLQRDLIDNIARTRVNLNIIKNLAMEMTTTEDAETIDITTTMLTSTEDLITKIHSYSNQTTGTLCNSCHNQETLEEFKNTNTNILNAWNQYTTVMNDEISPLAQQENFEEALEFLQDQLEDHFYTLMHDGS